MTDTGLILSFDPGVKHLAYCIVDGTTGEIRQWRVMDIVPHVKKPPIPRVTHHLAIAIGEINIDGVTHVRIEQQPTQNIGMKVMSHVLQALFIHRGVPDVSLVSAKVYKTAGGTYGKRKKASVEKVRELMKQESTEWSAFFAGHSKMDDLADCLLLARYRPG